MTNTTLTLNTKLPGQNKVIQTAKSKQWAYDKMKKHFTNLVIRELIHQKCVPVKPYDKICVSYEFHEGKDPRDPDNALAGMKFIHDAFVSAGIIDDDDIWHVSLGKLEFIPGAEYKVVVTWDVV